MRTLEEYELDHVAGGHANDPSCYCKGDEIAASDSYPPLISEVCRPGGPPGEVKVTTVTKRCGGGSASASVGKGMIEGAIDLSGELCKDTTTKATYDCSPDSGESSDSSGSDKGDGDGEGDD